MSLKSVKAALESRLLAIASPQKTVWENVPSPPITDGEPFQVVDLLPANPDNPTLGDGFYRERGVFQISLYYAINGGSGSAYARADAIRDWFARGTTMNSGGITVHVERTPTIGPKLTTADRFVLPVSVFWYANIFRP